MLRNHFLTYLMCFGRVYISIYYSNKRDTYTSYTYMIFLRKSKIRKSRSTTKQQKLMNIKMSRHKIPFIHPSSFFISCIIYHRIFFDLVENWYQIHWFYCGLSFDWHWKISNFALVVKQNLGKKGLLKCIKINIKFPFLYFLRDVRFKILFFYYYGFNKPFCLP